MQKNTQDESAAETSSNKPIAHRKEIVNVPLQSEQVRCTFYFVLFLCIMLILHILGFFGLVNLGGKGASS